MAQSEDPHPKMQLPELWATKMACPVCSSTPLGVFHPTGQADRFVCSSCETSFELENGGKRVRFVTLPKGITPWMRAQWVVLEEALAAFEVFKNGQASIGMDESQAAELPGSSPIEIDQSPAGKAQVENETLSNPPTSNNLTENPVEQPDLSKLIRADRLVTPKKDTSPFYPEDVSRINSAANPTPAPKPELEHEFWQALEAERVKDALVHPTADDFAGKLIHEKKETQEVETPREPEAHAAFENTFETKYPPEPAVKPTEPPQTPWPENPSTLDQAPVEVPSFDNLPPIRPLEDTPPSLIQPPQMRARTILNTPGEDLGDLRSHISFASNAPSVPEKMVSATERAIELQRLGNTDQEVRSILERSSGLTPEQVADVLRNLEKPEEKKHNYRLLLTFSIIAVILFTLLAWWFFTSQSFNATPAEPQLTQENISLAGKLVEATNLPAPLQTLMPNGIQIINEDPSVVRSTEAEIPAASCPNTKAAAAKLFGGPANDWTQDNNTKGWSLITKTQGVVIRIPANMTGGYLVFEIGPELRGVNGPAIVRNVYMISISCE